MAQAPTEEVYDEAIEAQTWGMSAEDEEASPDAEDWASAAEDDVDDDDVLLADGQIKTFKRQMRVILDRYRKVAKDKKLCQSICQADRPYVEPMSPGRRFRVGELNDTAATNLINKWLRRIPLQVQHVLGGEDRSLPVLLTLPKGRVAVARELIAGTPRKPLRRNWKLTQKRAIYFDFVEMPGNTINAYVGIARANGNTRTSYKGLDGRCGGYIRDRARGFSTHKARHHEMIHMDPHNTPNFRVGAVFEDEDSLQEIELLEDMLTIYAKTYDVTNGELGRGRSPEITNLVKHLTPDDLPDVPWKGMNYAFQSVDGLPDSRRRECIGCGYTTADLLEEYEYAHWYIADHDHPFGGYRCRTCHRKILESKGICTSCSRVPEDPKYKRCLSCRGFNADGTKKTKKRKMTPKNVKKVAREQRKTQRRTTYNSLRTLRRAAYACTACGKKLPAVWKFELCAKHNGSKET